MAINFGIGVSDFRKLRTEHCYYIDKTAFIEELLMHSSNDVTLFTRPRRFGKTLTMQMLREFFDITSKDKENIFEGLEISKNKELCREWQNQYPVVYLTLKDCIGMTFESILHRFSDTIDPMAEELKFLLESPRVDAENKNYLKKLRNCLDRELLASSLKIFCRNLYAHYNKQVILLIDEYDVPINEVHDTEYYTEMIKFIRTLLGSVLKDSPYLKFAVLTGCLRIARESIFTGLNNFKCYGISENKFSNKIGFTSQEVDALLKDAGLSYKKQEIKEWYDGYNFGDSMEIYCPWDVLQYVQDHQYDPDFEAKSYWMNSSGNDIIKDLMMKLDDDLHDKIEVLINGGCIPAHITEQLTFDILKGSEDNVWSLLYAAGYLTNASKEIIAQCGYKKEQGITYLVIPNKEVNQIYGESIRNWLKEDLKNMDTRELMNAFWNGDTETVSNIITDVLEKSISYHDYAEKFYHGILLGVFLAAGFRGLSNRESGIGRYDILVKQNNPSRCAIIEVKRSRREEDREKDAEEALEQINSRKYSLSVRNCKRILYWGMAFYKKNCLSVMREIKNG